jgi:hypothetical protein
MYRCGKRDHLASDVGPAQRVESQRWIQSGSIGSLGRLHCLRAGSSLGSLAVSWRSRQWLGRRVQRPSVRRRNARTVRSTAGASASASICRRIASTAEVAASPAPLARPASVGSVSLSGRLTARLTPTRVARPTSFPARTIRIAAVTSGWKAASGAFSSRFRSEHATNAKRMAIALRWVSPRGRAASRTMGRAVCVWPIARAIAASRADSCRRPTEPGRHG